MSGHPHAPLRDRLLSNSPDPVKSAILRDSGHGWSTMPPNTNTNQPISSTAGGSVTSPLRISKRDSPRGSRVQGGVLVPRRNSKSFKHVATNQLVSKSPFKSQIPTPSTPTPSVPAPLTPRKVSGEKRPRPLSMAENENPLGNKRRQSNGFKGLVTLEPVSKSPFKKCVEGEGEDEDVPPPLPPKPSRVPVLPLIAASSLTPSRVPVPSHYSSPAPARSTMVSPPPAPRSSMISPPPVSTPRSALASPARSALVSKRLHGPRSSDNGFFGGGIFGSGSGGGKKQRRKTVTFNECCDVVEFDQESIEFREDPFEDSGEEGERDDLEEGRDGEEEEEVGGHEEGREGEEEGDEREKVDDSFDELREEASMEVDDYERHHQEREEDHGRVEDDSLHVDDLQEEGLGNDSIAGLVESMLQDTVPSFGGSPPPPAPGQWEDRVQGSPLGRVAQSSPHGRMQSSPHGPLSPHAHAGPQSSYFDAPHPHETTDAHHAQRMVGMKQLGRGYQEGVERGGGGQRHPMYPFSPPLPNPVEYAGGVGVLPNPFDYSPGSIAALGAAPSTGAGQLPATYAAPSTPTRNPPPPGVTSPGSHVPLGRTSHSERAKAERGRERRGGEGDVGEEVERLPGSPSPVKKRGEVFGNKDSFEGSERIKDEVEPIESSFLSGDLSFGREVSLSALALDELLKEEGAGQGESQQGRGGGELGVIYRRGIEEVPVVKSSTPPRPQRGTPPPSAVVGRAQRGEGRQRMSSPPAFGSATTRFFLGRETTRGGSVPLVEVKGGSTPPLQVLRGSTPPLQVQRGSTPPLQVQRTSTPPLQVQRTSTPPVAPAQISSPLPPIQPLEVPSRSASPFSSLTRRPGSPALGLDLQDLHRRVASPLGRTMGLGLMDTGSSGSLRSNGSGSEKGSVGGRSPRISREDVARRLMKKRSVESPLREVLEGGEIWVKETESSREGSGEVEVEVEEKGKERKGKGKERATPSTDVSVDEAVIGRVERREVGAPLRRGENPTFDGVMEVDPEVQSIDPPRPSFHQRAHTIDDFSNLSGSGFEALEVDFGGSAFFGGREGECGDEEEGGGGGGGGRVDIGDVRSALDRLMDDVASSTSSKQTLASVGSGVKTAGDRGLGVGGKGMGREEGGMRRSPAMVDVRIKEVEMPSHEDVEEEETEEMEQEEEQEEEEEEREEDESMDTEVDGGEDVMGDGLLRRAATDTGLLSAGHFMSPAPSRTGSGASSIGPPVPAKEAIKTREEMILAKRREARRAEEELMMGYSVTPPKRFRPRDDPEGGSPVAPSPLRSGRPSKRRSLSTGDAEDLLALRRGASVRKRSGGGLLDVPFQTEEDDRLVDSINRELQKRDGPNKSKYYVKQREEMIVASSSESDNVSHVGAAGDVNTGRAWRTVRRPSDMNEYAKQIKAYRAQDASAKLQGKVFVRVVGVRALDVPIPQEPTALTCTLNNGIHYVTTPESRLGHDSLIDQEFELIEHPKLEFTLTLKIRRDPHIIAQFKANAPPPPVVAQPPPPPPPSKGGFRSFFSSPKKQPQPVRPPPPQPVHRLEENLARYLKSDGTLARAFIAFKDIAKHCDTKLFETSFPLIGQRSEVGNKVNSMQVGELILQIFRLPPLPGIAQDQLPQSLEECHRGLRHVQWHKQTYYEGTLTQCGGDCSTWRRRQFRVVGGSLIAFNDVTKKATATIDLKKALSVENDQGSPSALSPTSARNSYFDDGFSGVERSFRIMFPKNQEIVFFADTDDEKARWLEVLHALVGHIPPNPLWAELIWQRRDELAKQPSVSSSKGSMVSSSTTSSESYQPRWQQR
ncbi:hypothetical protein JAAARDRAFT_181183 [Jaapia argillacea MUCL 33604]|uniref:PH domain-containing protein n=1 Tax=Jaapia argillacea MUCL 33604 TaxID=933084 RepID=A0A067PV60_9AGAM|nr:hypothetical protein JAAARDRAFT_181183 [Jaapia argillacea MUCL 33604]